MRQGCVPFAALLVVMLVAPVAAQPVEGGGVAAVRWAGGPMTVPQTGNLEGYAVLTLSKERLETADGPAVRSTVEFQGAPGTGSCTETRWSETGRVTITGQFVYVDDLYYCMDVHIEDTQQHPEDPCRWSAKVVGFDGGYPIAIVRTGYFDWMDDHCMTLP